MSVSVDINDAGQAVLQIADAHGELFAYRFRLLPPGYSIWVVEVTRADTGNTYRVALEPPSAPSAPPRWSCTCKAFTFKKRGQPPCKHVLAAKILKAWLDTFTREIHDHPRSTSRNHEARLAV